MFKKAFTLAEILITLTIIGIVASLTIPSLINNIGDQQNRIIYKKIFADLSQVNQKVVLDNGGPFVRSDVVNANNLRNKYLSHLNYIKKCDIGSIRGNCWNDIGARHLTTKAIHLSTAWWDGYLDLGSGVVLNSGIELLFSEDSGFNCSNSVATYKECGRIFVDVNGSKEPNTWGKDIYFLFIYQDKLVTYVSSGPDDCTGSGMGCSSAYLYQ